MFMSTAQEELDIRRAKVYELLIVGLNRESTARLLGVTPQTVGNDIVYIRDAWRRKIQNFDPDAAIGEHIRFFEYCEQSSFLEFRAAPPASPQRNTFLNTAMKARQMRIDLEMKTGLIPQIGPQSGDTKQIFSDGRDPSRMSIKELEMFVRRGVQEIGLDPKALEYNTKRF